jgi:hypothetical protein
MPPVAFGASLQGSWGPPRSLEASTAVLRYSAWSDVCWILFVVAGLAFLRRARPVRRGIEGRRRLGLGHSHRRARGHRRVDRGASCGRSGCGSGSSPCRRALSTTASARGGRGTRAAASTTSVTPLPPRRSPRAFPCTSSAALWALPCVSWRCTTPTWWTPLRTPHGSSSKPTRRPCDY